MGKEVKIGLAVILLFGVVFCGVLYQRVSKLKTTKTEVANAEKPAAGKLLAESKPDLFASPNKLSAVAADANEEPAEPARRSFNWSTAETAPSAQPEMKTVDAAPPKASYLPTSEETPAASGRYADRYAERYSQPLPGLADEPEPAAEPASELTAEPSPATLAESAPSALADEPTADVANEIASEPVAATPAPSAVANPFARSAQVASEPPVDSLPVEADETQPVAPNYAVADELPANDVAATEPSSSIAIVPPSSASNPFSRSTPVVAEPRSEIRIAQEPQDDADHAPRFDDLASEGEEAPARLDPSTVTAAAASAPAPPASAGLYDRPSSRYANAANEAPRGRGDSPFRAATPTNSSLQQEAAPIASGKYRLGPNENFWTVSERAYGTGGYFKALHAYNAERFPVADDVAVGDELMVPMKSELERQFPQLCPKPGRLPQTKSFAMQASAKLPATGEVYVVQEGDTLFDIARYELGKASRWAEIYELNRATIGEDINFLRAGTELVLPDDYGKADAVTRQPGSSLR